MSDPTNQSTDIKDLFDALADLPAGEQAERLAEVARDRPALADAVRKLLEADDAAGAFLPDTAMDAAVTPQPPKHVGPYKLLQLIGEGGFGAVYLAEQVSPVRRRVAVKIIKPGMDSRQVIARFEAERQALAMMDHPNIARVFDAGQSPDGRPYFVMELVSGVPITVYCDENRLDVQERLKLLADVCRAVHHAHQKAIIHRDIKPNNVLITLHDGKPVVKVIDFGIAKALDQPLTDKTLFTEFKTMIGTPEYMSPEQAEISGLDIDTRADVYSLGVLAYELLVGVTPFDGRDLRSRAYAEMQRIIREVDPPPPSIRYSSLHTAASVAATRQIEPRRLGRLMRGELDWIVMRCLEKDRRRRYDSASALADDVERFLGGDPILARPASTFYRARKLIHRHRVLAGSTSAVVLALLAGLIATTAALRKARQSQRLAEESARSEQAARTFLERTISSANPYTDADDPTIAQVFERASEQLDAGELTEDPRTEATLRRIIGSVSMRIDRSRNAVEQLEKAVAFRRRQQPLDPRELARVLDLLATARTNLAEYDAAEQLRAEAFTFAQRAGDAELVEAIRYGQATALMSQRKYEPAASLLLSLVAAARADQPVDRDQLALRLEALAMCRTQLGQFDDAIAAASEAVGIRSSAALSPEGDRSLVESMGVLAQALGAAGRHEEAARQVEHAIEMVQKQQRPAQGTLTMLREILAARYARMGRHQNAIDLYQQVLDARLQIDGPRHPRAVSVRGSLGRELYRAGKPDLAKQQWREAWAVSGDRTEVPRNTAAEIASLLAMVSADSDSPSRRELTDFALGIFRAESSPRPILVTTLMNAWSAEYEAEKFNAALLLAEELLRVAPKVFPAGGNEMAQVHTLAARSVLRCANDPARAEVLARAAVDAYEKSPPPLAAQMQHARSLLGEALFLQGNSAQAAPLIQSSAAALMADPATPASVKAEAQQRATLLQSR